jgi:hypothetical protein
MPAPHAVHGTRGPPPRMKPSSVQAIPTSTPYIGLSLLRLNP